MTEPNWLLSMLATEPSDAPSRERARERTITARKADGFPEIVPQPLNPRSGPSPREARTELDDDASTAAPEADEAHEDTPEVLDRFHRRLRLADHAAHYAWQKLGKAPSLNALTSLAREALWMASRRFDPALRLGFDDLAKFGIRRAIIDFLRSEGFTARKGRISKGKIATESIAADEDDAGVSEVRAECAALAACVGPVFLGTRRRLCDAVDPDAASPEDLLADVERVRHVRAVLVTISREDRFLLEGYFLDDLTLEEVGLPLGIAKSWASRRMAEAIASLKRALLRARVGGVERSAAPVARELAV